MADWGRLRRCLCWILCLLLPCVLMSAAQAVDDVPLEHAGNDVSDRMSLQRGVQLYMNYCVGCHSLKYLRYSRIAADLGLSEVQVMSTLNVTGAKFGDTIMTGMPVDTSEQWFGKIPPDLSLVARVRGSDWIYTYLRSFYVDSTRPLGWNNRLFVNVSMPNPLSHLQGVQRAKYGGASQAGADRLVTGLVLVQPGQQNPAEFDQTLRDIVNFLQYAAEPAALQRHSLRVWVLLFLVLLTFLVYLLKKAYWEDVH
ncbi:cytochrome c1 [Xylella fastidiosa subsp. multiplex]|uniref:Cytochrome c1 n=11 Tax=Xylella fastidiosa TaxID=2371 RepID=A0A9Q4QSE8_XYLFS|nr:ubiquinol cytochrome C oxidoreductase, cytochrome C1 subunit [Xylella fastidiosa M12]ERI59941.1 cytochrome C [Xylella fastidiosa subsp. multiplex Griffin-1]EWG13716.1 ubiquinol cytochrome C oxidoreductase, cytochrome C1 subunit [Xylella fastidiosa Mul-MD]KFA40207.1 ubiquinol cytochrome C oxidoreductase, cytochrome C1 subunit [Xylella fastidiosa]MBE0269544.1 cytochrome c1 [Xylella fastidiosa subsp. multiplex]